MKGYTRLLITICISYLLISVLLYAIGSWDNFDHVQLDNKITIEIENQEGAVKRINGNKFDSINTGEKLTASIPIPSDLDFRYPTLCFTTYSCITKVWYHNQLIYSYGEDLAQKGIMIGTLYDSVIIPKEALGEELILECIATEQGSMSQISNLILMEGKESSIYPNCGNMIGLLIFTCVFVISFFMFFILLFLGNKEYIIKLIIKLILIILLISLYIISSQGFFHPLVSDIRVLVNIEYITFFFIPVSFALYFYDMYDNKILKRIIKLVCIESLLFFVICTILNYTTANYHYVYFLPVLHLHMVAGIILYLVGFFIQYKNREKEKWIVLVRSGFIIFLVLTFIELIRFYLAKKSDGILFNLRLMPMGIIIVISMITMGIFLKLIQRVQEIEEKKQLEKLAYTDILTGLSTRTKFYYLIEQIKKEDIKEYTIFFIDLNDLKYYNDKYGHGMGDDYIKAMANIMKECFDGAEIITRFGGDEFIILYLESIGDRVFQYQNLFYKKLKSVNDSKLYPFKLDAACGVVTSTKENPLEIEVAIASADEKMYENKKIMKEGRT